MASSNVERLSTDDSLIQSMKFLALQAADAFCGREVDEVLQAGFDRADEEFKLIQQVCALTGGNERESRPRLGIGPLRR